MISCGILLLCCEFLVSKDWQRAKRLLMCRQLRFDAPDAYRKREPQLKIVCESHCPDTLLC
jgi:hypothetical protein